MPARFPEIMPEKILPSNDFTPNCSRLLSIFKADLQQLKYTVTNN